MQLSNRSQVDPFIVMDVMEDARRAEAEGRRIIHMEIGQPSTAAPRVAQTAVRDSLEHDALGYTVALGLPALRQRIAKLYQEWYNVDLDPSRVVVTAGSSGAFLLAFTALFNPGDRVGIGMPGYPSYRQILKSLSLVPVDVPTLAEHNFQPRPSDFANQNLAGCLVASPANPTGAMLSQQELTDLCHWSDDEKVSFISDEIYHGIEYDKPSITALSVTNNAYVINSFSKFFSMTGWRIGWLIAPEDHVRTIERLAQNMFLCPSHIGQVAALAAFDGMDEMRENLDVYRKNRTRMVAGLQAMGLNNFTQPDGAFYIYLDVSEWTDNSVTLSKDILDKVGVAVTPGLDFDPIRGHQMLRLSYAGSTSDVEEGLSRLKRYLELRG